MTEIKCCPYCEHLRVIISQGGNYHCPKKDIYIDYDFYCDCEYFKKSKKTLREKEERVWG